MNGGNAAVPAATQRLGDQPEHGARHRARREVGLEARVGGVELAGDGVDVVAALGDRQRHDPRGRVGQRLQDRLGVVGGEEVAHDRPDDPGLQRAVGVLHHQRVETVLLGHHVAHAGVVRQGPDPADAPVHRLALVHEPVDVHRLVCPVEATDTEVHDAGGHRDAVVRRPLDAGVERCQRSRAEVLHGGPP